jgi:hypothetical protein
MVTRTRLSIEFICYHIHNTQFTLHSIRYALYSSVIGMGTSLIAKQSYGRSNYIHCNFPRSYFLLNVSAFTFSFVCVFTYLVYWYWILIFCCILPLHYYARQEDALSPLLFNFGLDNALRSFKQTRKVWIWIWHRGLWFRLMLLTYWQKLHIFLL